MGKEQSWLLYFNPCGQEVVKGYVNQTCVSSDCERLPCFAKSSWQMAKFVLDGSDIETEKKDLLIFMKSQLGYQVISPSGETIVLTDDNKGELAEAVTRRARKILKGVKESMSNTIPISEEFVAACAPEQKDIMEGIGNLQKRAESFRGNHSEAVLLASQMRDRIGEALDAGLGNVDLIVRKALVYGLADRIPAIDSTGTIFVGSLEKIKPAP